MKHAASDDTATSILADSEFICDSNKSLAKHPCKDAGSKALCLLLNSFNKCAAALPYSDPREICIESYLIRFVSARGFQIYR